MMHTSTAQHKEIKVETVNVIHVLSKHPVSNLILDMVARDIDAEQTANLLKKKFAVDMDVNAFAALDELFNYLVDKGPGNVSPFMEPNYFNYMEYVSRSEKFLDTVLKFIPDWNGPDIEPLYANWKEFPVDSFLIEKSTRQDSDGTEENIDDLSPIESDAEEDSV